MLGLRLMLVGLKEVDCPRSVAAETSRCHLLPHVRIHVLSFLLCFDVNLDVALTFHSRRHDKLVPLLSSP